MPPTSSIDWLDTYRLSTNSKNFKSNMVNYASGKWTGAKNLYWTLDPATGEGLGITAAADGNYYISPNQLAWILQASTDPSAQETVKPYSAGIASLLDKVFSLASYKDVTAYQNAIRSGDKNAASNFLIKAVNGVMVGSSNLVGAAKKMGDSPVNLTDYVSYQSPAVGPRTVAWTRNQQSQVAQFAGSWLGYKNPAVINEITNAINKGMSAYEVEQQLFAKNPDPSLSNAAKQMQAAFPAIANARQSGKDIGIDSPAQYLQAKNAYVAALRPYGLANEFSAQELDNLILNTVTPQDLSKWVGSAQETVMNASPELKSALASQFGVTEQNLLGYLLRPENVGVEKISDDIRRNQLYTQGKSAGVTMNDAYKLVGLVDQGQITQQEAQKAVQQVASLQNLGQEAFGFQQGTQTTATPQDVMSAVVPEFADNASAAADSALRVQKAQEERGQAGKAGGNVLMDQSGVKGASRAQ